MHAGFDRGPQNQLPTWDVDLGREAHPKIVVRASDFLLIAHAAPECIVASSSSGKALRASWHSRQRYSSALRPAYRPSAACHHSTV